jgi:hypothetical protein
MINSFNITEKDLDAMFKSVEQRVVNLEVTNIATELNMR